ncbi:armadillo-type protein [Dissophora ornata]|nr:armadillo-type protein [Dissophora ornata]
MVTPSLSELQFRLKLTGSVADLLKKLKDLHAELKTLEQEAVDTSSLSSVTKQLIDPSIVNHKDKGVRIYAACCIADLLRIYAPDAPYTNNNLKVIFGLFVNELRHISTPTSPYFSMYYYLLESLSVVKSIVLITDLKNADELMVDLFRNIFDDIRPQQAKNVQICMSELLQHIIDEASQLPQDIVDIILAQFLHKQKFDNPAAYRLACDLGNNCADKLQRYVFQYFSDIISTAGNGELSSKEMADFKTVHQLVIELNKSTPALLLNVIPQLEEELKLSDITIRTLATKSLGEMFAEKSSQLATQYESTWRAWLQRRNDKIPQVRIVWIESLVKLIKAHGNLAKELSEGLAEKLVDPDEKVRAVACKTIGEFDYEASLHHIQKNTLIQVGHRCRDKKKTVSKEAINTLSVLYNQAYPEIELGTQASISHFSWMPSAIFHAVYVNDNEIFAFVDHAVFTTLFPPHGSAARRTQRLVTTFAALDDKGRTGFLSVLRRSVDARYYMSVFLQLLKNQEALSSKKLDSEEFEKKLGAVIKILCDRLPDPVKSSLLLHKYAQVRDAALLQSISDCMDSRLSLKEIRKAGKEALSRIETISPSTLEVLTILIQRISLTLVNSEILSELIKNIGESEEYREVSGELLRSISLIFPAIFKDHLVEITSLLRDPEFAGASDSLQTLAEFAKQFPKSVPADAKAKETLQSFLETGSIEQARHATIVLASIPNNENMCKSIAESINKRLLINSARLLWDLTILSQLALYAPQAFETISSSTISFIIKKLLMTNTLEQETVYEPDVDWVEKSELDEYSLSKVMGLKVLVNRAIVLLESDPDSAQDAVRPVFKLLWTIINQDGELADEKNTNAVLKSHLRLNAARLAIKLTRNRPVYEKMVSVAEYNRLALVIQDPVFRVRHGFASRIMKYLRSKELHIRYLAVLILTAHEPEAEWRLQVRSFLIQQSRAQNNVDNKLMLNELTLARAMHLLANHPDFIQRGPSEETMSPQQWATHSIDDLNLAVRYIEFYMDTMANSENVSLIYYIASLLKTVRFANPGEPTQNLYVASDLAQYVIQERSRSHNWTLTSYPGQVKLPRELFVPLDEDKLSVSTKSYLPSEWVHTREHKAERKPKVIVDRKIGQAAKRRSRSPSSPVEDDDVEDEKNISSSSRVKRAKKSKVTERVQEEPTRRMASRAAKVKTAVYKDAETSEEEADELESGEDSS